MPLFGLFGEKTLEDYVDRLPNRNITVRSLQALDFAAPGEWKNPTDFDALLREVTGETDESFLQEVKA
ncbi:MAG: hypothetical protein AAGJ31_03500, partial [Verrucomicrobiota bacterium]